MTYPEHQLWALAVAAVITELDGAHHTELGGWSENEHTRAWCKNRLLNSWDVASPEQLQREAKNLYQAGHTRDARKMLAALPELGDEDDAQQAIVRVHRDEIEKCGLLAWDSSRLVAVLGWAAWAGYIPALDAWQVMLMASSRLQQHYDSWESFARGYELGRSFWAKGEAHEPTAHAIAKLLSDEKSPWKILPWQFDLGVTLIDPNAKSRFKKTLCPTCGAPKTRPSASAYVYCDYCGSLSDYDFAKACEKPRARPGPVYEQLAAALAPKIEAARARGDSDAFRAAQLELFGAWADACPDAIPVRARDPAYRAKYIAYLAESAAVLGFDEGACTFEAALREAMTKLKFVQPKPGMVRVDVAAFRALFEVVLAREAHAHVVSEAHGLYAMHPDGAPAALQRRMSMSLFAQGWLPMLDEQSAAHMLARLGLTADFVEGEPVKDDGSPATCGPCGAPVVVATGARRMVCEHCGHRLDVQGARVTCSGCGASLAPAEGATGFSCPHCKLALRHVELMK